MIYSYVQYTHKHVANNMIYSKNVGVQVWQMDYVKISQEVAM